MALLTDLSALSMFAGLMVVIGGIVLLVSIRYIWRATAVLRASEISKTREVTNGTLVRVTGRANCRDDDPLIAPFSASECVALQYSIEEWRLSLLYVFPWYETVHDKMGTISFDVATVDGTVPVVEPARTVTLAKHVVETVAPSENPSERISAFEQRVDAVLPSTRWRNPPSVLAPLFRALSIGTRRYSERRVVVGDEVTVVGRIDSDGIGINPLVVSDRSPVGTVLRMAKISFVGLCIGLLALPFGIVLLL